MPEFRLATQSDSSVIAEMEEKYIECPWSQSVVKSTIADDLSAIYLLVDNGEVIGYGGVKMVLDTAEVYNIAVREDKRRLGYGAMILEKLIGHAVEKGAVEMFLEVNENNTAAIMLYTKSGFKISYMRKNYYKTGNALILKREI